MVDKIYEVKNKILERIEKDVAERGVERLDPQMVDMVKDLAEAEKACWEAEYYRSVTEAMDGASGYSGGGQGGSGGRSGWQNQYGSGRDMGRGGRRGYGDYHGAMEEVRHYMQGANPDERERMRAEMRSMMDGSM